MCVCFQLYSDAEGKVQRKFVGTCFRGVKVEAGIIVVVVVVVVVVVLGGGGVDGAMGVRGQGQFWLFTHRLRQNSWVARPMREARASVAVGVPAAAVRATREGEARLDNGQCRCCTTRERM